jgi:hypothetical protein
MADSAKTLSDRTVRASRWSRRWMAVVVVIAAALGAAPAQSSGPKSKVLGTWTGTSTCVKAPGNEACHDELVIYRFVDTERPDTVVLWAEKLVNGKPEPMYDLELRYDRLKARWTAEYQNARVHILWSYTVLDKVIVGTCSDIPSGFLRRNVKVVKE